MQTLLQTTERLELRVAALEAENAGLKNNAQHPVEKNSNNSNIPYCKTKIGPKNQSIRKLLIEKQAGNLGMKGQSWSAAVR